MFGCYGSKDDHEAKRFDHKILVLYEQIETLKILDGDS